MIIDPNDLTPRDRYFLMIGSIVPRPIALISTLGADGTLNLAPFSFFNGVSSTPPVVGVAVGSRAGVPKDTWTNVVETKEFVVNVVDEEITDPMVLASGDYGPEVDEFVVTGLTPVPSDLVKPPRVGESPISFECRLRQVVEIGETPGNGPTTALILGDVLRVHLRDGLLVDGHIDADALEPVGRMGNLEYCRTGDRFERRRPKG